MQFANSELINLIASILRILVMALCVFASLGSTRNDRYIDAAVYMAIAFLLK